MNRTHLIVLITKTKQSKSYIVFSLLQVAMCLFLLAFIIFDPKHNLSKTWVILMESLLTLIIIFDVIIRIISYGNEFFYSFWNLTDLGFCILISIFMIIYYSLLLNPNSHLFLEETDDLISLIFIIIYYGIQCLRIVYLLKQSHRTQQMLEVHDIQFNGFAIKIPVNQTDQHNFADYMRYQQIKNT